jgi:2-methylisocitrate lyase-like PEP mutase family enzyme
MKTTTRLRQMITGNGIHVAPGAFDGLTARLVEQAGFEVLYASGGAIARSAGVPDIGLLSVTEVTATLAQMADVTTIPIIADADTGFGNQVNAVRTLAAYERIGLAGLHIEDQTFPKRCGHLDDKPSSRSMTWC